MFEKGETKKSKNVKYENFAKVYSEAISYVICQEFEPFDPKTIDNLVYENELDRFKRIKAWDTFRFCSSDDVSDVKEEPILRPLDLKNKNDLRLIRKYLKRKDTSNRYITDEEEIKKVYGDKNCEVTKKHHEWTIWVNQKGNKIKITHFQSSKTRLALNTFFKNDKPPKSNSITLHLDHGNFYISSDFGVRCNNIKLLNTSLIQFSPNYCVGYNILKSIGKEDFSLNYFFEVLNTFVGVDAKYDNDGQAESLFQLFVKYFFKKKNIEFNPINLYYYHQYRPKTMVKKDLIQVLCEKYDLDHKNKFIRRVVMNTTTNLHQLKFFVRLFGTNYAKYLNMINDPDFFKNSEPISSYRKNEYEDLFHDSVIHQLVLEKREMKNIISIINDKYVMGGMGNMFLLVSDILDHVKMIRLLRPFYTDINFNSTKVKTFKEEHRRFSARLSNIRNPFITKISYHDEMLQEIEKPIETVWEDKLIKFRPYVLKDENDYKEEGSTMHHCVGGYTNKESSVIISLRFNDERVTCEFKVSNGELVQARYYSNQNPPDYYEDAIAILFMKVERLSKLGMLNAYRREIVPNVVNGKVVKDVLLNEVNNVLF